MPVIIGTDGDTTAVRKLVSPEYRDLSQYQKVQEVQTLQAWLSKQAHLPRFTDDQILTFLHACEYSTGRTKEVVDNYCTLRGLAPELFTNRNIKSLCGAFSVVYFSPLLGGHKTNKGHVVAYQKLRTSDSANFVHVDVVKGNLLMMDILTATNPLCNGLEVVIDMDNATMGHLAKMRVPVLKKFLKYVEEGIPIRLKAVHIINVLPLIDYFMALIGPLMKPELLNLIHFHKAADFDKFTENHIPRSLLPSDYGGEQPSLEKLQNDFEEFIREGQEWIESSTRYKSDETKRCGKSKTEADVFGMQGSFKKLDLD